MLFDLNTGVLLKITGRIVERRVYVKQKMKRKHLVSEVQASCLRSGDNLFQVR